jgi:hypothetical protein
LARDPFLLETSVPNILAAGDVRHASIKRCAAAVGEGGMSIAVAHQCLAEMGAPAQRTEAGAEGRLAVVRTAGESNQTPLPSTLR